MALASILEGPGLARKELGTTLPETGRKRLLRLSHRALLILWAAGVAVTVWAFLATGLLIVNYFGPGFGHIETSRSPDSSHFTATILDALKAERQQKVLAYQGMNVAADMLHERNAEYFALAARNSELEALLNLAAGVSREPPIPGRTCDQSTQDPGCFPETDTSAVGDSRQTIAYLIDALESTTQERSQYKQQAEEWKVRFDELDQEWKDSRRELDRTVAGLRKGIERVTGNLSSVFERFGITQRELIKEIDSLYAGSGGPDYWQSLATPVSASARRQNMLAQTGLHEDLELLDSLAFAASRLPFGNPVAGVARLTSGFGYRIHPVLRRRTMHQGIDFASDLGTGILATAGGVVEFAGRHATYGKLIRVRHGFEHKTVYAHLSRILVSKGDVVERGEKIGEMGNTGLSTGVHLHYEILVGNKRVDPLAYIEANKHVR